MPKVSFELPDSTFDRYSWLLNDGQPASQTPLISDTPNFRSIRSDDTDQHPSAIVINGFPYVRSDALVDRAADGATFPESLEELRVWRSHWLPQAEALAYVLEQFDPASVLPRFWGDVVQEHQTEFQRVFRGVHQESVGKARLVAQKFVEDYVTLFGVERKDDAYALLQGFPNLSLDRAKALWGLSRLLRRLDGADGVATNVDQITDATPVGREFNEHFTELLKEFGDTTNSRMQDLPTCSEDTAIPFAMIRGYSRQADDQAPWLSEAERSNRRLTLEDEMRTEAAIHHRVAQLMPLMTLAQELLPNSEDHNLLVDQRLFAASRARWLAIGGFLQGRGAILSIEEVFYYHLSELISTLEGEMPPSREVISTRRSLQSMYRSSPPPRVLGKPMPDIVTDPIMPEGTEEHALRGTPAAPGIYPGRARIVESLSEASLLNDGDVLVCRNTTPEWTPYFGLVGAIVMDAGGILSHGAIVAREFGVPAVVGAMTAVIRISEGATVTVDGSNGVVVVELDV